MKKLNENDSKIQNIEEFNKFDISEQETIDKIKNKYKNVKLDEEFKINLAQKLDEEYNKSNSEIKKKKKSFVHQKLVAACACFVFIGGCVFASRMNNHSEYLVANTYQEFDENEIDFSELKEQNSETLEYEGFSLKLNYALFKDDDLYMFFDLKTDKTFEKIYLYDFKVSNSNGKVIFNNRNLRDGEKYDVFQKFNDSNNVTLLLKLENLKNLNIEEYKNICITQITGTGNENYKCCKGNWKFDLYL